MDSKTFVNMICLPHFKYAHFLIFSLDYCMLGKSRGYLGFSKRFVLDAVTQKIFHLAFSNLVCGYIGGRTWNKSFVALAFKKWANEGHFKVEIWVLDTFWPSSEKKGRAHDLKDHKYDAHKCLLYPCKI